MKEKERKKGVITFIIIIINISRAFVISGFHLALIPFFRPIVCVQYWPSHQDENENEIVNGNPRNWRNNETRPVKEKKKK